MLATRTSQTSCANLYISHTQLGDYWHHSALASLSFTHKVSNLHYWDRVGTCKYDNFMQLISQSFPCCRTYHYDSHARKLALLDPLLWLSTAKIKTVINNTAECILPVNTRNILFSNKVKLNIGQTLHHQSRKTDTGFIHVCTAKHIHGLCWIWTTIYL